MNMHPSQGQPPGAPHHYPSPHGYPADPTQVGYPPGVPHLHMGPHGGDEHLEDVNDHDDSEDHATGEGSGDQPPKRKRRRQALSCTECKRRKIKCDRQNPCSPCIRRGDETKCKWHIIEPVEKFVTRSEYEELRRKFEALEHAVAQIAGRPLAAIYQPAPGMPSSWVIPQHMGDPDHSANPRPVGVMVDPNLQTADVAAAITNANNAIASTEVKKTRGEPKRARRGRATVPDPISVSANANAQPNMHDVSTAGYYTDVPDSTQREYAGSDPTSANDPNVAHYAHPSGR